MVRNSSSGIFVEPATLILPVALREPEETLVRHPFAWAELGQLKDDVNFRITITFLLLEAIDHN